MPSNNVDKSKYKLLTEYNVDLREIKNTYYSFIVELLDNKYAMVLDDNINIYKNDSLNILFTIHIDVHEYLGEICIYKITSLFCMQNGNLMASTFDGFIYILSLSNFYPRLNFTPP
jgi:hypothetical protein